MKMAVAGGGFFYAPFTVTRMYGLTFVTAGALNVFGNWTHIVSTALSGRARWIVLQISDSSPGVGRIGYVQIGAGAVGAEQIILPTSGPTAATTGFRYQFSAVASIAPFIFNFPYLLAPGQELSIRANSDNAAVTHLNINMLGFD